MTNMEALAAYDADQQVTAVLQSAGDEHAAQVMAFETLRGLMAHGLTSVAWDEITDCALLRMVAEACDRASLIPNVMMHALNRNEIMAAGDQGGSYFSAGLQTLVDGVQPEMRVTFTKTGGIVA